MKKKDKELIVGGAVAVGSAVAECLRRYFRAKEQETKQKKVDETAPKPIDKSSQNTGEIIQFSIVNNDIDWDSYQRIDMGQDESDQWKSLVSTFGGEAVQCFMATSEVDGLLKCDMPLSALCRVKDNPELMRGFFKDGGKFKRHATFSEVKLGDVAPLIVFRCMAALTSQYYQQINTEKLDSIKGDLENIIKSLNANEQAKIQTLFRRIIELSGKSKYDIADKMQVVDFYNQMEVVRDANYALLPSVSDLKVEYAWSNKKEADLKIEALEKSGFFHKLDMAMKADTLLLMADILLIKIAVTLGDDEDRNIYLNRMNLNLNIWDKYIDRFNLIKHDVLEYLRLQSDDAFFGGSINEKRGKYKKIFDEIESSMLELQNKFDYKSVHLLKFEKNGTLKEFVKCDNL